MACTFECKGRIQRANIQRDLHSKGERPLNAKGVRPGVAAAGRSAPDLGAKYMCVSMARRFHCLMLPQRQVGGRRSKVIGGGGAEHNAGKRGRGKKDIRVANVEETTLQDRGYFGSIKIGGKGLGNGERNMRITKEGEAKDGKGNTGVPKRT